MQLHNPVNPTDHYAKIVVQDKSQPVSLSTKKPRLKPGRPFNSIREVQPYIKPPATSSEPHSHDGNPEPNKSRSCISLRKWEELRPSIEELYYN